MSDEIRPFPISKIGESVLTRLNGLKDDAVIVAVDGRLIDSSTPGSPPQGKDLNARFALMVKKGQWSFGGWLSHTSSRQLKDTEAGFEVRRFLGGA